MTGLSAILPLRLPLATAKQSCHGLACACYFLYNYYCYCYCVLLHATLVVRAQFGSLSQFSLSLSLIGRGTVNVNGTDKGWKVERFRRSCMYVAAAQVLLTSIAMAHHRCSPLFALRSCPIYTSTPRTHQTKTISKFDWERIEGRSKSTSSYGSMLGTEFSPSCSLGSHRARLCPHTPPVHSKYTSVGPILLFEQPPQGANGKDVLVFYFVVHVHLVAQALCRVRAIGLDQ